MEILDVLRNAFQGCQFDDYLPVFARHARPVVGVNVPSRKRYEASIPVGKSRIGGCPDLPEGFEWPGVMDFIAQLNLRELREVVVADELPENGMLYVFYGGEPGEMNEGRLMYTSEPTEHLQRSDRLNHEDWLVSGRPLEFSVGWSLPDIHSLAFMDMRKEAPLKYADSDGSEVAIYSEALYSVGPRYSENCVMTMFGHAGCSVYGGTYPEPDDVEDPCIYIHESSRPSPSNKAASPIDQARSICAQWTHLIELNSFYEDPEKRPLCPKFSWGDGFPYQFWIHNDDLDQFAVEKAIGEMCP